MSINQVTMEFFEKKYKQNKDPWEFATSQYELYRYDQIYQAINYKYYNLIVEPGCSIGVLTEKLSTVSKQVEASDFSPTAISLAKARCAHLKNISFSCESLVHLKIKKNTDLLILAEIGYYFEPLELKFILLRLLKEASSKLTILGEHWLGTSPDHIITGLEVHDVINSIHGLKNELTQRNDNFCLDRWVTQ